MVDPRPDLDRDVHAAAGHHGRQRRPARHPARLGASLSSLQWVVDAYSLTLAAFLLTAGSLGDRLGRRRVFSIGFGIFTFASFLCGISGDPTLLNLARGLQGVGGAAMFATSLALIGQEFHGKDRATAFGVWGATIGGAVAIGPLVGGVITEHLGWEWIFFVNVPIGLTAIALTETQIANVAAEDPERIDFPGLVTFSLGLFLLIFGLIRGNPEGWGSTAIVASLVGAASCCSPSSRSRRAAATRCSTSTSSANRPSTGSPRSPSASRRGCSRCSST